MDVRHLILVVLHISLKKLLKWYEVQQQIVVQSAQRQGNGS
jgi:hypothetical protein